MLWKLHHSTDAFVIQNSLLFSSNLTGKRRMLEFGDYVFRNSFVELYESCRKSKSNDGLKQRDDGFIELCYSIQEKHHSKFLKTKSVFHDSVLSLYHFV